MSRLPILERVLHFIVQFLVAQASKFSSLFFLFLRKPSFGVSLILILIAFLVDFTSGSTLYQSLNFNKGTYFLLNLLDFVASFFIFCLGHFSIDIDPVYG